MLVSIETLEAVEKQRDEARTAARWLLGTVEYHVSEKAKEDAAEAIARWPWLEEEDANAL